MIKVRLWGEPAEIETLIECICNDLPGVRVLSVSKHYKDRGASVYERCYLDVTLNGQGAEAPAGTKSTAIQKLKH